MTRPRGRRNRNCTDRQHWEFGCCGDTYRFKKLRMNLKVGKGEGNGTVGGESDWHNDEFVALIRKFRSPPCWPRRLHREAEGVTISAIFKAVSDHLLWSSVDCVVRYSQLEFEFINITTLFVFHGNLKSIFNIFFFENNIFLLIIEI